jgi:ubiquitin-protein ligase E3 C
LLGLESILVEPQFSLLFLNKLLGKQNSLDDLKNLDPEYYKNLMSLRHMSAPEIANLGLTFELQDSATTTTSIELMPGGSNISVTKENVIQYIHLVSHQKMNVRGSRQTLAFLHGFRDIIPAQWVRLFSAYELQKLISGDDAVKGIDVQGMMSVMRYSGGFHPSQPIVQWLWEVVDAMTPDQQRKFLKFMTSCSRQPLLGFASMVPAPCIQQIRLREDDGGMELSEESSAGYIRLPTSSTCMNLLKLPKYTSKEMLREKLLYAIEAAAGFELS